MSTDVPTAAERPMRADGRRNRERVLAAARASFAEGGPDVAVAEIAKRAGVGSATLFRHFPTKDDLMGAVMEQMLDEVAVAVEESVAMEDPWASFVHALTAVAEMQARDQMFLRSAGPEVMAQERFADSSRVMMERMNFVLERAQSAGVVRKDLASSDVPLVLSAVGGATEHCGSAPASPELWRRYLAIILDGLRPEGAHALPQAPLSFEAMMEAKHAAHHKR